MIDASGIRHRIAVAVVGLMMVLAPALVVAEPNTSQSWGKQIYLQGTSPTGGEITANVGTEGVTLPASAVPCSSCHGTDGIGRPEGGVQPSDIRWSELTKVYGHVHENGRKHPAFDENNLARLIRTGLDPASNRLDQSMPLYNMSVEDMNSLVAYIRFLETDWDPGLSKESIQVGTLLPLQGQQAALGQAMAQVMLAHFKEMNQRGGIFGRKLELMAIPYGSSAEATIENLRGAFKKEGVFALVGAYTIGLDEQILELLREEKMPMVGPFTLNPGDAFINADIFYIYSGFNEQAQALVELALKRESASKTGMVFVGPESDHIDGMLAAVKEKLPKEGKSSTESLRYQRGELDADDLAENLQKNESDAVLFLGNQAELEVLLNALAKREHNPRIYALSSFVPRTLFDAPEAFNERIFLAYPTMSSDISAAGRAEYLRLADLHALPPGHVQGQVAALAAAKLLEEGLRGAGHTLNRERLVEAIEALYRYDTGLTPPLTYGPNRRIGAKGAHVMMVDIANKTNTPVGEWYEVR